MPDEALIHLLSKWDGKKTEHLKAIYRARNGQPDFWEQLVEISLQEPEIQGAATWLLKHYYHHKHQLPEELSDRLLIGCRELRSWPAKLHLLQILPEMSIPETAFEPLYDLIRSSMRSENKFLRAWSYQGAYELSKHLPELRSELKEQCLLAMDVESAAVKARVKRIWTALQLGE